MNMNHLKFVMEQRVGDGIPQQPKVAEPPTPINAPRATSNGLKQVVVTWEGGTERQVLEIDEAKG